MSRFPFPCLLVCTALVWYASPAAAASGFGMEPVSFGFSQDDDSDKTPAVPAKNAGSIDGQVVSVDYKLGHIAVKAGGTQYDVIVAPSTEFRGHNNNFHTIADIQKGAHVQVMMSQRAGTYTAQIIRLF